MDPIKWCAQRTFNNHFYKEYTMKKILAFISLALLLSCLTLGCSSDESQKNTAVEADKNAVERLNDRVAEKAVNQIKKPINKAKAVQEMMDANSKKIDEMKEAVE